MRKLLSATFALTAAAAAAIGVAPAAGANSYSDSVVGAGYSYNDGADQFCVSASRSSGDSSATARLTSLEGTSRGPSISLGVENGGRRCASLATAYEDTHYQVVVRTYRNGRVVDTEVKRFYS